MAEMEKQLAENEAAQSRETEITLAALGKNKKKQLARTSRRNGSGSQKPLKVQTMGQCERCGYLSSQKICKAFRSNDHASWLRTELAGSFARSHDPSSNAPFDGPLGLQGPRCGIGWMLEFSLELFHEQTTMIDEER
ncbi:hypothetical protein CISG_01412 [Coccidioides immitis RMSCC 3703]|uniref:Uncharacterized protein n=1 Tax=Coccidioides immitis RMSCC 3703 TaxID=454286 RepID=A0A0J8R029_COCIT|nr:hypothetical protein CISG_01412 [Coccidioides immitis RMSCC 3703]